MPMRQQTLRPNHGPVQPEYHGSLTTRIKSATIRKVSRKAHFQDHTEFQNQDGPDTALPRRHRCPKPPDVSPDPPPTLSAIVRLHCDSPNVGNAGNIGACSSGMKAHIAARSPPCSKWPQGCPKRLPAFPFATEIHAAGSTGVGLPDRYARYQQYRGAHHVPRTWTHLQK